MKFLLVLMLLPLLACCDNATGSVKKPHEADCTQDLSPHSVSFYRCENDEVLCYRSGEGLSCHWKNVK